MPLPILQPILLTTLLPMLLPMLAPTAYTIPYITPYTTPCTTFILKRIQILFERQYKNKQLKMWKIFLFNQ